MASKRKKNKNKNRVPPARNPFVAPMRVKSGGGTHKDRRKEIKRRICREKINEQN